MPWKSDDVMPCEVYVGSSWIPTRAAACAHCVLRCSVGATTVTWLTVRSASSSAAMRSANVVLPAPGVATARKSCGDLRRYSTRALRCQTRSGGAAPPTVPADAATGFAVKPQPPRQVTEHQCAPERHPLREG